MAVVGVIEAVLFGVTVSKATGNSVPVKVGVCPAVPTVGVTGILKDVVPVVAGKPAAFGFVQLTVCPEVLQVQAPLTNVKGAVKPFGKFVVNVN